LAACPTPELGVQTRLWTGLLVSVDNESPPGSWRDELARMPWKYNTSQEERVRLALAEIRQRGLWDAAQVLEQEITALRAERR